MITRGDNYSIQETNEPNFLREVFPYTELPHTEFEDAAPPLAEDIWITDTTFRDGQQARPPYTVQQIVDLYALMHKLDGDTGMVRQSEFFLYSKKDREAVEKCLELGFDYPEVTGWIRAVAGDFNLVKAMGLPETGTGHGAKHFGELPASTVVVTGIREAARYILKAAKVV